MADEDHLQSCSELQKMPIEHCFSSFSGGYSFEYLYLVANPTITLGLAFFLLFIMADEDHLQSCSELQKMPIEHCFVHFQVQIRFNLYT